MVPPKKANSLRNNFQKNSLQMKFNHLVLLEPFYKWFFKISQNINGSL